MAAKVYIETSVVSYYSAHPSRDVVVAGHQQAPRDFWNRLGRDFDPFVSAVVLAEAGRGNEEQAKKRLESIALFPVIQISPEAEGLAHHIVDNPFTRMMIRQIVENGSYVCPEVVSPDELVGEEI
jgi:hypothetical protein